ncbi:MAG: class I SAM-dependent methyltransferase [Fastidiosipilaceae bacterium]|jgi:O-methyltransferase involved in polyketide biosynthesis
MKYQIEKNTVQETLMLPLYARNLCTELFPQYFRDHNASRLMEKVAYDFGPMEARSKKTLNVFGALEVAMRQTDLAEEVKLYLKDLPRAAVVNLGCGLDNTGRECDNGQCLIYNLDLPDVIEVRNALLPAGEREENIACDLNNLKWMDRIDARHGVIFFAAGVFYYFKTEQVKIILKSAAERFKGGRMVFDACGPLGVKMMLKTWIKQAGIKDVGAYLSVRDAQELSCEKPVIKVSSRGYMRGYCRLGKDVKGLYRLLSYIGDEWIGMKIVRLDFGV